MPKRQLLVIQDGVREHPGHDLAVPKVQLVLRVTPALHRQVDVNRPFHHDEIVADGHRHPLDHRLHHNVRLQNLVTESVGAVDHHSVDPYGRRVVEVQRSVQAADCADLVRELGETGEMRRRKLAQYVSRGQQQLSVLDPNVGDPWREADDVWRGQNQVLDQVKHVQCVG